MNEIVCCETAIQERRPGPSVDAVRKDYADATQRLERPDPDAFSEVLVREVEPRHASFYGRDGNAPDEAIVEHSDIIWAAPSDPEPVSKFQSSVGDTLKPSSE